MKDGRKTNLCFKVSVDVTWLGQRPRKSGFILPSTTDPFDDILSSFWSVICRLTQTSVFWHVNFCTSRLLCIKACVLLINHTGFHDVCCVILCLFIGSIFISTPITFCFCTKGFCFVEAARVDSLLRSSDWCALFVWPVLKGVSSMTPDFERIWHAWFSF